jgi:hypothetical protein
MTLYSNSPPSLRPSSKSKNFFFFLNFIAYIHFLIWFFFKLYRRVETTKVPTQKVPNKKVPNRKGRDIESELLSLLSPDFYDDYFENQPHDIQSAFHTGPYNPVPLPFFRTYQPAPNIAQLRQSSFLALLGSLFTSRSTITYFGIKTSTLTPTCSVAGPIPQCPNI